MIDHEAGHFGQPYLACQADVTHRDDAEMSTGERQQACAEQDAPNGTHQLDSRLTNIICSAL